MITKVVAKGNLPVHQEIGKIEKFWYQFSHILKIFRARTLPARADVMEKSIGDIELSSLESQSQTRKWFKAHKVV
jgi:hypothetical protein